MMGAKDISVLGLTLFFLLLIPILLTAKILKLKINKRLLISMIRMVLQLTFVGIYLNYLFEWNNIYLNIIYVLLMVFVAAYSVIHTAKFRFRYLVLPVFISILLPLALMLIFFNRFVVGITELFNARYLIPIGGMILGNCLRGNIISLSSFLGKVKSEEKIYQNTLLFGATRFEALLPYFRHSILAALDPTIASISTIGLVALPGMMTGQILGGSFPLVAIKYQIAIMLAIFITQFFSVILVLTFTLRSAFDQMDMLDKNIFQK